MFFVKKTFVYIFLFAYSLCLTGEADAASYTQIPVKGGKSSAPRPSYFVKAVTTPSGIKRLIVDAGGINVRKGDTVYSLSRRYNVPMRSLIRANRLSPPYSLKVGQRLKLPDAASHVVRKGDTIYSISRHYNVDMRALAHLNKIKPPYTISLGQKLFLPSSLGNSKIAVASGQKAKNDISSVVEKWLSSSQVSDSGNKAASASKASKNEKPTSKAKKASAKASQTKGKKLAYSKYSPSSNKASAKKAVKKKAKKYVHKNGKKYLPAPDRRSSSKFAWPVKGMVISKYGLVAKGQHNDGVNIKVKEGSSVKAAENGVVAYAGNEIKGFGNLLLIKHSGGWMTAYAHNSRLVVKRGEKVKRGQVVAKAGSTGNVKTSQVHFEVRAGKKAVDPLKYMAKRKI
ncbi:MAG: LysM peptidoglycan-binding domain-containing protein [Alphaproteobacteria bacterium]|nr:LysM peptidoglycan-binding domain-containing protein [Alphaproteobacteria bacterium]